MWSACHSLTKLKYVSLHSIPKGMSTFASQFDTPLPEELRKENQQNSEEEWRVRGEGVPFAGGHIVIVAIATKQQ